MLEVFIANAAEERRSALRRDINWEQLGFSCSGEASDGEMALTMLRREPPDLLITDLSMPWLDGLELCRRVRQELPRTRILILTSSRQVEHLQRAVEIGVDGYLFEDAPPEELCAAVIRVRTRLEEQRRQDQELQRLRERAEAYQSYQWDCFFKNLVSQDVPVSFLYDLAETLNIDLRAEEYCILVVMFRSHTMDSPHREQLYHIVDNLKVFFDNTPQFDCFPFHRIMMGVLVKTDTGRMESQVSFCIRNLRRAILPLGDACQWVLAYSNPVTRISSLPGCFAQAMEVLSYSALLPGQHVLTTESLAAMRSQDLDNQLRKLPPPIPLSEELDRYLRSGTPEEARSFALHCVSGMGPEAIQVPEIGRYIMLRIRLATMAYVHHTLHLDTDRLLSAVDDLPPFERILSREGVLRYLSALLARAVELRRSASWSRCHPGIQQALHYIDQCFSDPELSLSQAAQAAGLSPNYFSSLFRQEMGCTFGAYLTEKRISRARELLRSTPLRTAQVGCAVGYPDAHYFSNLFRKKQGCTPREYRSRADEEQKRS